MAFSYLPFKYTSLHAILAGKATATATLRTIRVFVCMIAVIAASLVAMLDVTRRSQPVPIAAEVMATIAEMRMRRAWCASMERVGVSKTAIAQSQK